MKSIRLLLAAILFTSGAFAADATSPAKIKIILVGDSTVNDGGGWGYGFKQFLTVTAIRDLSSY